MYIDNSIISRINNDPDGFTIEYATKLLERASILINNELSNASEKSEIDKFVLFKTLSSDVCFACELLMKSKIHSYHGNNNFSNFKDHNLKKVFEMLDLSDQNIIIDEMKTTYIELEQILQNDDTSDAFIKRYLYEKSTGIPDYNFLCDFANALLKLNDVQKSFDLKTIEVFPDTFDTTQFDYEEILERHSNLIYKKAEIFDSFGNEDIYADYIIRNMKSCDYAFFSELRYKYFDKDSNPKMSHEFSELHKRLKAACEFYITKGSFCQVCINDKSDIPFVWTLDSLMYDKKYKLGFNLKKDLYQDLDTTFEQSRFCTSNPYENYDRARMFKDVVKATTDLLIMDGKRANDILIKKEEFEKIYSSDTSKNWNLSAYDMEKIDIDFIRKLSKLVDYNDVSKKINKNYIIENNPEIQAKILFYIKSYGYDKLPYCIDYIVTKENDNYVVDLEKYDADIKLQDLHKSITPEKIDLFLYLLGKIKDENTVLQIINFQLDPQESVDCYEKLQDICGKLSANKKLINGFIDKFALDYLRNPNYEQLCKKFTIYEYFSNDKKNVIPNNSQMNFLSNLDFERIVETFELFKKHGMETYYLNAANNLDNMDLKELNRKLDMIKKDPFLIENFKDNSSMLQVDLDEFNDFRKMYCKDIGKDISKCNFYWFKNGTMQETYDYLKNKGMLFLYEDDDILPLIKHDKRLDRFIETELVANIPNYSKEDKKGIQNFIKILYSQRGNDELLFNIVDLEMIVQNPELLKTLNKNDGILKKMYDFNIYNDFYNSIKNNTLTISGSTPKISEDKKNEILYIIKKAIMSRTYYLDDTLEKISSNSKLFESMTYEYISKYDFKMMEDVVKSSKFSNKDFRNYNFYDSLFNTLTIKEHYINYHKVIELFNELYKYKNCPEIKDFVKMISDIGYKKVKIVSGKDEYKLNDISFDNLISKVKSLPKDELISYLNESELKKDVDEFDIELREKNIRSLEERRKLREKAESLNKSGNKFYDLNDLIRLGKGTLGKIKDDFIDGVISTGNDLSTRIANNYLITKLKAYRLKRNYHKYLDKEDEDFAK